MKLEDCSTNNCLCKFCVNNNGEKCDKNEVNFTCKHCDETECMMCRSFKRL
jgi:hypothetical protein